jgi:DNA invertase Pin-like site-specific DNA recombinase
MKFGYARVSSNTQDHAAQVEALKAAGCERIYSEKASGKSTNGRPEFAKLMKALRYGDVVTVVKLDRLARSSRDLHNILHELQELGCGFVSLGESWCDTTTDVGRLVMTIMGGIAEFERSLIRKRCEEGIQRARRKGTIFGRPSALDPSQRRGAVGRRPARAHERRKKLASEGRPRIHELRLYVGDHEDDHRPRGERPAGLDLYEFHVLRFLTRCQTEC